MAFGSLLDPIFDIFALAIIGFFIFQIWNIIQSYKIGKLYDFSGHPMWGVDKQGKYHSIMRWDAKEDADQFGLARISAFVILAVALVVVLLIIGVIVW